MDMIELTYFSEMDTGRQAYQVIQFRPGESWQIVEGDEVIGRMDKQHGVWRLCGEVNLPEGMVSGIAGLIEAQHFNRLPLDIKSHWSQYVHEVVVRSDTEYLVVCKVGIDFSAFERLFRECVSGLIKDPWEIRFRVYDAVMSADFEVRATGVEGQKREGF
jgi:hypothetical protein